MNQMSFPPKGFIVHEFNRDFHASDEKLQLFWNKLLKRETFTRGQIFPYRVEFSENAQAGNMISGELNIHHGPFLSAHGAVGEISKNYRNLNYFYGSYVLSFRLIRLVQLEFFKEDQFIKLKFKVYLRPWFAPVWEFSNRILWSFFGMSMFRK